MTLFRAVPRMKYLRGTVRTLRARLAGWLVASATWISPVDLQLIGVPIDDLYLRARELALAVATFEAGGEFKAHQVYAKLQKEFPDRTHRSIRLVIEAVLHA